MNTAWLISMRSFQYACHDASSANILSNMLEISEEPNFATLSIIYKIAIGVFKTVACLAAREAAQ